MSDASPHKRRRRSGRCGRVRRGRHQCFVFAVTVFVSVVLMFGGSLVEPRNAVQQVVLGLVDLQFE